MRVDLRGPAAAVAAIGLAVGVVGTVAVLRIRQREDQAGPIEHAALDALTQQEEALDGPTTCGVVLSESVIKNFSTEIDLALEDTRVGMSSAEAQRYLLEILLAASIIAQRMQALSNARIEEDAQLPELASAMEKLTTQHVTDTINRMLEAKTSLLDDETAAIFVKIFGGGQVLDMEYVRVRNECVKAALRLPAFEVALPADRAAGEPPASQPSDSRRPSRTDEVSPPT